MGFNTEHQKNIAFDLLRFKRNGVSLTECFEKDESIIIYGLDFIGKEVYYELKDWTNVICFIDRSHDMQQFEGIQVFSIDNDKLKHLVAQYESVKILVVILSDWNVIYQDIISRFRNAEPISMYFLSASLKLKNKKFFQYKQQLAINIVKQIIENKSVQIKQIVLVGTSYTELLSFLLLPDWQDSLYIAERFLPSSVVDIMTENNIPCLYEEESGEFYDICYLIAEYAKQKGIPVYGHDHMNLSRAFWKNSITVIEDGTANYYFNRSLSFQGLCDDRQQYLPFGFDRHVHKVFLTGLMDIPKELEGKAEYIEPFKLWNMKDKAERSMIADIFSFPYDEILNLVQDGKDILFLTEPYTNLKGHKSISAEQQIEMYREILSNYSSHRIMIKPHPSDNVDYENLMPEYTLLSKQFPIQIIEWTGIKLKKIIMMCGTSCINSFSNNYEIEVHKDILDKYGLSFLRC